MTTKALLPQTGDSQDIGDDAERCLFARRPKDWTLTNLGGTGDYGFDYQVQTTPNQQVNDIFRIQLKGTRSPKVSSDNAFISITLSASTVRYYARVVEPILLVLCDLSDDPDNPAVCPLYYVWMRDELRRIGIESLPAEQIDVNLRVLKSHRLTRQTDLSEDIRRANELSNVGHALNVRMSDLNVSMSAEERLERVRNVEQGVTARGAAFLEALAEPVKSHWVEPARGTHAWHLREAKQLLRSGKIEKAKDQLRLASDLQSDRTDLENADFWHLTGRVKSIAGDTLGAKDAYWTAAQLNGQPAHWVAWAESEIRHRYLLDMDNDFSDVIEKLHGDDPAILGIKARLLGAEHKYDDALALLDTFTGVESLAARVVVQTMQSNSEDALKGCLEGLALPELPDTTRQLFLIMKARARFALAVGKEQLASPEEYLPPGGLPGLDVERMKQAWTDIEEAVEVMQDNGWSTNADLIADVWAAAALMLGKHRDVLAQIIAAANAMPHVAGLQSAAETIAAQCDDIKSALQLNARLPDSDTTILRRITFLHEQREHRKCYELFEKRLPTISQSHQFFGTAATVATLSAHEFAKANLVKAWLEILNSDPALRPHYAVANYLLATAKNKLGNDDALAELESQYEALGQPFDIALTLFHQLDPSSLTQAEKCIRVGLKLKESRILPTGAATQMGFAYVTTKMWPELLSLCAEYKKQFNASARMKAFEGLALDRLGRADDARLVLEEMLGDGMSDSLALNTYVNIMVRCGFVDEALLATETILQAATKNKQKMDCVRLLFNITQTATPNSPRLLELAIKMGELVDPTEEAQEGVYLCMVLTGTLQKDCSIQQSQLNEFQRRADAFFNTFPDSKILKKAEFNPDAPLTEILAMISSITGNTEEQKKFRRKLENQLQNGDLPMPYAWRPRHALSNIHDIVHLWETAKQSGADDRKYHLSMTVGSWSAASAQKMRSKIPLLDMTALLVISDLSLMEQLFTYYPKIAIAQSTLIELAQLVHPLSGSPWLTKCRSLQDVLKRYFSQVLQPGIERDEADDERFTKTTDDIKVLCENGEFQLFSDDAVLRIYCAGDIDPNDGLCTLDFLNALEEEKRITADEAAAKIAQLCDWHVGLHVMFRYQIALFPSSMLNVKDVTTGIGFLQKDTAFMSVATAIWDIRQDFLTTFASVKSQIKIMIEETTLPDQAIASYAGIWYVKTKLRGDMPLPPLMILAKLMLGVATFHPAMTDANARRLWTVYNALVQFEHGSRMDQQKENESIALIAQNCAEVDVKIDDANIEKTGVRLAKGLTKDTAPSDIFLEAYSAELIKLKNIDL